MTNPTQSPIDRQKLQIVETQYWKVILGEDQEYLGRSYVSIKRDCPNLSEVTDLEWADLKRLIVVIESAFKKAFDATHFNWSCLMNDAYKKIPPHPHVHWHMRPRYSHDVTFAGIVFKDLEFGHHYARSNERVLRLPEKQLVQIVEEVRKHL
ncbi:MAG: HIT family protein [Candidatus Roizmanbacteria bacterium]